MRFVLDASMTMALCFEDEASEASERVLDALAAGEEAIVPAIWAYEVANVLRAGTRGRLPAAKAAGFLEALRSFSILVEPISEDRVFESVLSLARQYGLTVYDAAYLEVAMRHGLPLATLDAQLRAAAGGAGVALFGEAVRS